MLLLLKHAIHDWLTVPMRGRISASVCSMVRGVDGDKPLRATADSLFSSRHENVLRTIYPSPSVPTPSPKIPQDP